MRKIIICLLIIFTIEILTAWTNYFGLFNLNDKEMKEYMAHGNRSVKIINEKEIYSAGDTFTIFYSFETIDTSAGRKIFAHFLAETDTSVKVENVDQNVSDSDIKITLTHSLDSNPVARGWTIDNLTIGDTLQLSLTVKIDSLPAFPKETDTSLIAPAFTGTIFRQDSFVIKFGMEKDYSEKDNEIDDDANVDSDISNIIKHIRFIISNR